MLGIHIRLASVHHPTLAGPEASSNGSIFQPAQGAQSDYPTQTAPGTSAIGYIGGDANDIRRDESFNVNGNGNHFHFTLGR